MINRLTGLLWEKSFLGWLARTIHRLLWIRILRIPDSQRLWRAVYNPEQIRDGKPKHGFFQDKRGLSCDLSILTTLEKSRRGTATPPWPDESGLIEFGVADVRSLEVASDVNHFPVKNPRNYAHCQLTTKLTTDQAKALLKYCKYVVDHKFSPT